MYHQIAAPVYHRINIAEISIQTFKNYFFSIIHECDPEYPANKWYRLIKQTLITLNMVRPSIINPKLSTYNQILGVSNFGKTPLAPPGCKIVVH